MDDTKQEIGIIILPQTGEHHKFTRDIIWVGIAQFFSSIIIGIGTMPASDQILPNEYFWNLGSNTNHLCFIKSINRNATRPGCNKISFRRGR